MTAALAPGRHTVGVVGIGRMGWPMAARLRQAGFAVAVFDTDGAAVQRFAEEHDASATRTLEELARGSDAVVTMLPDGAAVRSVVAADDDTGDGLAKGLRDGQVLVDMSSSEPSGTVALADRLAERGVALIDAPVSGGVARAERGELSILVGGDPSAAERVRPALDALGSQVFLVGPVGAGHAMKALNNLLSATGLLAAAEVLLVGRRFGLDPAVMLDVLNASTGRNNSTENKLGQFVLSGTFASGFSLGLMNKDLQTALRLARERDVACPLGGVVAELWSSAEGLLSGGADHTAVVQWLESLNGTTLAGSEA